MIYLNSFGDPAIQNFEKWKNKKKWPCSHVEAGKLSDLFQKRFIRIPSLNIPEMRPSDNFRLER